MTRSPRTLLAAAVLAATAACGIPADDDPRAISQERLPEDVRAGGEAGSAGQTVVANLYFSRFDGSRDRLVVIEREVPVSGGSSVPTPRIVLEALLAGVQDDDEAADTIATKIPPETELASRPDLADGVLTVDLNAAISGVAGPGVPLAYGQMVCTADALDEVEYVRFTVEGQPVQPHTGEGDTTSRPVTCSDYDNVLEAPLDE